MVYGRWAGCLALVARWPEASYVACSDPFGDPRPTRSIQAMDTVASGMTGKVYWAAYCQSKETDGG